MIVKWLPLYKTERVIRSLMIGIVLCLIFAAIFGAITEDVARHEPILRYDQQVEGWLLAHRPSSLVGISNDVSLLGNSIVIAGVSLSLAAWWAWKRNWQWAIGILMSVFSGGALAWILKILIHRPRPDFPGFPNHETDYSFPSGHATLSLLFYGFLAYLLIQQARNTKWRWPILFILALVPVIVGVSRLLLGVHYPTDIFAGWDFGAFWLTMTIILVILFNAAFL